uniref:Uncharacterized protein n=1 Tax=Rhizophora mucronata TaxID=61149 RepID=A0A2P2NJ35_RHIMU
MQTVNNKKSNSFNQKNQHEGNLCKQVHVTDWIIQTLKKESILFVVIGENRGLRVSKHQTEKMKNKVNI